MEKTRELIQKYYDAFNNHDMSAMLDCLSDDVIHDINQGTTQKGKQEFANFMVHMNQRYRESIDDLIIMTNDDGTRAAAELIVQGTYLTTDQGLPEANGQTYRLPVGAFFEIKNNKITRVTVYYNLKNWLEQIA